MIFKHSSVCFQLENSAFELCEISSAVERSYSLLFIQTLLELWRTMNSFTCLFKMKMQSKLLFKNNRIFVFFQILFVTCHCMTTNISGTFLDIAKGKTQVLKKSK